MAKNILEDIKPLSRPGRPHVPEYKNISEPRPAAEEHLSPRFFEDEPPVTRRRKGPWIIAGIALVVLFFALSFLFARATVKVTPKTQQVDLGSTVLVAKKDSTDTEALSFELMTLSADEAATVPNATAKTVAQKASGKVVVYNNFGPAAQKFAPDTRLETKDGKIYKISGAITVPGTTIKNGETIPGSLEVTVYAEKPGEAYNIDLSDFTIFGFKGTPKYSKFYARSRTPISGGSTGLMYVASNTDGKTAYDAAALKLRDKLIKNARAELPKGFLLFDTATVTVVDDAPTVFSSKDPTVPITVKGTLYGFIVDEKQLTQKIAENSLSQYDGKPVSIPDMSTVSVILKNKDKSAPADVTEITLGLSGKAGLVWDVDPGTIANALVGKKKSQFQGILAGFTNVDTADVSIRPLWRGSFPENTKDIHVITLPVQADSATQ